MSVFRLLLRHLFFICLFTSITSAKLRLFPTDVPVSIGEWATITCLVPCQLDLIKTHTLKWYVGDNPVREVKPDFEQRTGIKVEYQTISSCTGSFGFSVHQLRIFASSVRVNRTAFQCATTTKSPDYTEHFSYFGVILVKDELQTPTTPSEVAHTYQHDVSSTATSKDSTPLITPTPCLAERVTVTVTQTATVMDKCPQVNQ